METGYRNNEVSAQLGARTKVDGRGVAFDSSAEFILPSDRLLSRPKRAYGISRAAASDSGSELLRTAKLGLQVARAVPEKRTLHVYRPGILAEELSDIDFVAGEGPVTGFWLELKDIWEGL